FLPADVRKKHPRLQYFSSTLVLLLGLWLSGFAPLVITELPHLAFALVLVRILIHMYVHGPSRALAIVAVICGAAAVSIRLQGLVHIALLAGLFFVAMLVRKSRPSAAA